MAMREKQILAKVTGIYKEKCGKPGIFQKYLSSHNSTNKLKIQRMYEIFFPNLSSVISEK